MKKLFSFVTMLLCVVASAFAQSAVSLNPSDVADIKAADDADVVQSTTDGLIVNFVKISGGGKFTDQLSAYGGANVGLVKFDLSSIPGGATITGATISCDAYCTVATKNSEIIFASVSTDWDGSTVTWNNFNENNSASQIASSGWTEKGPTKSSKSLTVTDQVNAALENNVVAFAIYTSTGREHNVSNIHLDVTYVEGAVSKYNYTVNAVTSGASGPLKTLAEGEEINGVATTVTYPFMIEVGGKYYKLVDSSSFSVDVTNSTPVNIEYEAVENVVAYGEAESSAGSQLSTEGNYSAGRLGNFAANNLAVAFTLPAGSYMFNVAYADRGDRGIYLRDASNSDRNADVIGLVEGIAKTTPADMYSIEFSLKEETEIAITGWTVSETKTNQSAEMDYFYVVKAEAPKAILDYVAKSSVGDISYTGQVTEGEEVTETYNFPRYINVDGTLYETSSSDGKGDYRKTFTFNADNLNQVVEYTATDIKPVFFSEGEDLTGATVAGGIPSRTSMTKMGYGTMNVTTLPAGKYEITVNVSNGNSSERKVTFVNGENELAALTFAARANVQIKTTEEITLAEETEINVIAEGSSSCGIDFLYIVKTGEYIAPAPATYTLTVKSNDTAYGDATANVYEGIAEGQEVTLSAVPADDCYFINWTVNGNEVSKEQTITVNVVSDSTFVANFGKNVRYDIVVVSADENMGTVSGSVTGVLAGDPVSISAYPNEGYEFDCWIMNGGVVSEDAVYTTTATANTTYTARFRAITHNVTVSSTEGGSASGSGEYAQGSTVTIEATPDEGYDFVGWYDGSNLITNSAVYSFQIKNDATFTAKFEKNVLTEDMTITISQIGYNTITPDRNIDLAGTAVKGFYASSASDNTVTLTRVYELVAGEAYLLAGDPSKEYGVTATTSDFPAPAVNYFVPVTEDVVIGEKSGANTNCYLTTDKNGKNAGFYVVEGTQTIGAGKAYLSVPLSDAAIESITLIFEDEDPTSVELVETSAADTEGWYTLGGVKVNKPAKGGIYVHGGKTLLVK